jgi:N-acyl homoserine lactone hydrolase
LFHIRNSFISSRGESGLKNFDNNVKYRASLQNYVIDTGDDVILVDTGFPKETPGAVWDGKAHSYIADGSRIMYPL